MTNEQKDRDTVITRVFDAPRALVWSLWTEAHHIAQWWGPEGFTTRVDKLDFRVGGRWNYVMVAPDGKEYPSTGVFREIVPLERIVSSDEFDEGFPEDYEKDLPEGVIVLTILFEDLGEQTKVTLRIIHSSLEDRKKHEEMGVVGGWQSSFDCLDGYLRKLV